MKELILNNSYINWMEGIINKYGYIDDSGFLINNMDSLSEQDKDNIYKLKKFYSELIKFRKQGIKDYILEYNGNYYLFGVDYDYYCCTKCREFKDVIHYKEFKNSFKKSMNDIFDELKDTVCDSLDKTDIKDVNKKLNGINKPTIVTGVGGSFIVSDFASKVLNKKNKIITRNSEVRDLLDMDLTGFYNILSCSYSGSNYGVDISFLNNLKHYLLTAKDNDYSDVNTIKYNMDKEDSFISLGATLVPCSILLNYYLDGDKSFIDDIHEYKYNFDTKCDCFEIFSGYDTSVLSNYLDSTITEAGIGIPVVHDKYSYCHGRSTLSVNRDNIAIYFNKNTDLDKIMLEELPKYYKNVVKIDVGEGLKGEYKALVQVMYLSKYLASEVNKDLALVDYSPIVKKLYRFKGSM